MDVFALCASACFSLLSMDYGISSMLFLGPCLASNGDDFRGCLCADSGERCLRWAHRITSGHYLVHVSSLPMDVVSSHCSVTAPSSSYMQRVRNAFRHSNGRSELGCPTLLPLFWESQRTSLSSPYAAVSGGSLMLS
ncbi:hypothetical protein CALCODRAFT_244297 [Calocera cornea HHB12733]|uniref:Uncharacterized protein n=1 Tax=Calocera cornea HHB12733 TaxID=1353952 RepID=A0A165GRF7_9BASI|nr:hypothetical protein CALCODRAFT_244297 [Calocera cornea HHB12733]